MKIGVAIWSWSHHGFEPVLIVYPLPQQHSLEGQVTSRWELVTLFRRTMVKPIDVVNEALKHQGYIENPGKDNVFGKWFGFNHTAWCAMFVSYCFNKAGAGKLVNGVQHKNGFYGCTASIKVWRERKQVIATKDAQAGDIIYFDWEHDNDPDHVGIVVSNNPKAGTMVTIEGNTTDPNFKGNQSNGGHVVKRTRYYTNIYCVVRPKWDDVAKEVVPTPTVKAHPVIPTGANQTKPTPNPIPEKKPNVAPQQHIYHTVVKGDTYWDLGEKYGIPYKDIQKRNKNAPLKVGGKLVIK